MILLSTLAVTVGTGKPRASGDDPLLFGVRRI